MNERKVRNMNYRHYNTPYTAREKNVRYGFGKQVQRSLSVIVIIVRNARYVVGNEYITERQKALIINHIVHALRTLTRRRLTKLSIFRI